MQIIFNLFFNNTTLLDIPLCPSQTVIDKLLLESDIIAVIICSWQVFLSIHISVCSHEFSDGTFSEMFACQNSYKNPNRITHSEKGFE